MQKDCLLVGSERNMNELLAKEVSHLFFFLVSCAEGSIFPLDPFKASNGIVIDFFNIMHT